MPAETELFTYNELLRDLAETRQDIADCMTALLNGIRVYSDAAGKAYSVQERLDANRRIERTINQLLENKEYVIEIDSTTSV